MKVTIDNTIENLLKNEVFLSLDDECFTDEQKSIIQLINLEDFYRECSINSALPNPEVVSLKCRKATRYLLFTIVNELGEDYLRFIKVVDGYVSNIPHTCLLLDNTYYLDITLAQYTSMEIPRIAITPMSYAKRLYKINRLLSWREWVMKDTNELTPK